MRKSLAALLIFAFTVIGVSVASAHTVLIASNPAKGSIVKVLPRKIILKFADSLLTLAKRAINRVIVTDPHSKVVTTGKDLVKGAILTDPMNLVHPIVGIYNVSYRVSAQDGHIVSGSFTFRLQR
ncbi:MAG TPA: copper resistance CopC family protein [Candidatus Nanopelagicaceae bacterium]